jgi:hypothetical protein
MGRFAARRSRKDGRMRVSNISYVILFVCLCEACVWVDMNIAVNAAVVETSEAAVKLDSFTG